MNQASFGASGLLVRAGVLVTLSMTALAACGAQELDGGTRHAFFVRSALAPPNDRPNGTCVYSNDANAPALFEGRLDVGIADSFQIVLAVQGSDAAVATSVTGGHVVIREGDEPPLRSYDVVTNGYIEPGARGLVSFAAMDAPTRDLLLPSLPNRVVSRTVFVEIELTGRDPAGGSEVSTPVFRFPVKVCNGCLVDFSDGNDPTYPVQPNCFKPPSADARKPCFVGQDEVVPCGTCVTTRPACDPSAT